MPENFEDEDLAPGLVDESLLEHHPTQNECSASGNMNESQEHMVEPVIEDSPLIRTSPYEQQYDGRGYPQNTASGELTRRSRRAMNDVLATVGVCVGVDADGQKMTINDRCRPSFDRAKLDSITTENGIGLVLDSADMMLLNLASMFTVGFRQKLQVCETFGVPFRCLFQD